ncbi:hypothetical protein ISN76_19020 [Dyella halodurans]|uniref:YcxB family protein n=1 Tax=Dyella halodurans TaxID=1920171 RepID=A0ABV9C0Q6_9GAMM|nr:hypothetical protein [Dyella halodurans]
MDVKYQYLCDTAYFKVVIDRQYRQGPWLLRLPIQFGLIGVGCAIFFLGLWGMSDPRIVLLIVLICGVFAASGVWATKFGIMMKFRRRQGFGTEAVTLLSEVGVGVGGIEHHTVMPWSAYPRAVRFPDGILLKRPGGIRWLPDSGITFGSVADATALVASKTSLRSMG